MIPYRRQNISEEDIQAVVDVLHSYFLTHEDLLAMAEEVDPR
jgi:dTDP-4-amino-4,6-dideoxygalactose transaminase